MYRPHNETFVSDPQLFIDYYTKQTGSGPSIGPAGLGNEFGSLQSRIIPLGKPKNRTDIPEIKTVHLSPAEAAVNQAKEQYKREQEEKKELEQFQNKKRKSKGKISVKPKRKRKERDIFKRK